MKYTIPVSDYGDLMTVAEFVRCCVSGTFTDYDGYGRPVCNGKAADVRIYPSKRDKIPEDATHIVWFNR